MPRSGVFPYYVISQHGSNANISKWNEEQGPVKKIGILKKQRAYRNLFVLIDPKRKEQGF